MEVILQLRDRNLRVIFWVLVRNHPLEVSAAGLFLSLFLSYEEAFLGLRYQAPIGYRTRLAADLKSWVLGSSESPLFDPHLPWELGMSAA